MSPAFRPGPVPRSEVPPEARLSPFSARIHKIGINPLVDVPEEISVALEAQGVTPVCGLLEDTPIRGTLVPAGKGRHRLFLNTAMREAAGVGDGDLVRLALARDPEPRETRPPVDLLRTLKEHEGALETFEAQTPSRRRELVVWLEGAKRAETRQKRLQRILDEMLRRRAEKG